MIYSDIFEWGSIGGSFYRLNECSICKRLQAGFETASCTRVIVTALFQT